MRAWPGRPSPLGAACDGTGVNFALYSENATRVELCLFDSPDAERESARVVLSEETDGVWHGYLPGLKAGQLYGYRVHGPYEPAKGHRFNPNKVLLDPYARAIGRAPRWGDELFGYPVGRPDGDLAFDERDSAALAPLAAVLGGGFDWGDDRPPRTPWHRTVIYEAHVKGFTKLHPGVPEPLRGTYAGLASTAAVAHFKKLGVSAVELMPVYQRLHDRFLVDKGLSNYWGYSTLGYFAPDVGLAAEPARAADEFKGMVKTLHRAGLEVILDVVYNHTAEGSQLGPTLSFRGIDNAAYYRLAADPRYYMDFTACGNTFNMLNPRVLQLIMDSLRYWVTEMRVDGFRFDLASTLARELFEVDRLSAFFDVIRQDPVLSEVKLIAEPWDLGEGGYQVGNFPVGWAEWNGRYRDAVRRFWKSDGGTISELATRLSGSSDLYAHHRRRPYASINYITCHDGFTLQDLVSYDLKQNEANGEDNKDGSNDNNSWNCGIEGPSADPAVTTLRERQKRNLLATLIFSQGVPMISGGDELGRTQRGNNNAYCQDNELSWLSWDLGPAERSLLEFTAGLVKLRAGQPVLRRRRFLHGRGTPGAGIKDIAWLNPGGGEMTDQDWSTAYVRTLGVRLAQDAIDEVDERGRRCPGDTLLFLMNSGHERVPFTLPERRGGDAWEPLFDTARPELDSRLARGAYSLEGRSFAAFRLVPSTITARPGRSQAPSESSAGVPSPP
ncbi:MAG: glycogen debranching protein GlgX [Elusimicrobia bacterium]|nr:glycogen debranching protein GlgX [Elusimicrobiota bacterium]